jgi:uncharacterized membrane protein
MSMSRYKRFESFAGRVWPLWPLHTILLVLFLGPIISPLFRLTGLPLISDSGLLARSLLASYICPTPQFSYLLGGLPMAVCARCWGATIGLLLGYGTFRFWSQRPLLDRFQALAVWQRLLICGLPFLLWPLEIVLGARAGWNLPYWLILLNGIQAGYAAGLFFCSIWPGLKARAEFQPDFM